MKSIDKNYIKTWVFTIIFCVTICSCKAQNIYDGERNLYTLKNYEHCLFYDNPTNKAEGIDLRKLDCSINFNKKYFTPESKELLLEVIKKKYSDEYIKEVSKKRVFLSFKSRLEEISEKLKDSANFMYANRFNKRHYSGYKRQKEELEELLSDKELDTIAAIFKRQIDNLYNSNQNYKISNSLIYAVAFVEEKDKAIPFLKGLLKDTTHINASSIKLSLAKLKVEPYYTNQITKLTDDVNQIISNKDGDNYINSEINRYAYSRAGLLLTKEAILLYSKVLGAKYFDTIDHGDYSEDSIPIRTISNLLKLIKNEDFQSYYEDLDECLKCKEKDIKWAIKWFKLNKDKLKINKEHTPSLHNKL